MKHNTEEYKNKYFLGEKNEKFKELNFKVKLITQ